MFERGARQVYAADTLEQARAAARQHPDWLLCGERGGLPLPDFHYGNSPAEFARCELPGQELLLTTTNGSRAFFACPPASVRLAGCFRNASAVIACALQFAQQQASNIAIVCAGQSEQFALDDSACAGYLVQEAFHQHPDIRLYESALAAQTVYAAYPPARLREESRAARAITKIGLHEDLELCMSINASNAVPMVEGVEPEHALLMLRKA
jgi:2-phosphosulfolactate phosphatase